MLYRSLCICSVLFSLILADSPQTPLRDTFASKLKPHRVAIIGAGAGGSSASYYLNNFSQSSPFEIPLDITVFDASPVIGGRTVTVNALDDDRYPTELGASIFVKINHILYNATRDFGLTPSTKIYQSGPDTKYQLGIWDGDTFVFKSATEDDNSSWRGWWDIAKLLWKYGWSPIRMQQLTKKVIGSFLKFYEEPLFPFQSLQEAVALTGLTAYTGSSGKEVLQEARIGQLFSREIIQASTRVNYASNLGGIHGLETLVCMAIEGALAVDGGNWQIFDEMVKASASQVFLNTTVTEVSRNAKGTFDLRTTNEHVNQHFASVAYDIVILAAPYQFANISFTPPLAQPPAKIPYVSLYVTLFTSPHRLSPSFFGLDSHADVPSAVLTTLPENLNDELGSRRGVDAVGPPRFWSVSTLRLLYPDVDGTCVGPMANHSSAPESAEPEAEAQYLYKIFSPAPLTGTFLSSLLDFPYEPDSTTSNSDPVSSLPKDDITWVHEKYWHSYPYEIPTETFENFTLSFSNSDSSDPDAVSGLWYLSGMESFISTMETNALAGMNVAKLIIDRLESEMNSQSDAESFQRVKEEPEDQS